MKNLVSYFIALLILACTIQCSNSDCIEYDGICNPFLTYFLFQLDSNGVAPIQPNAISNLGLWLEADNESYSNAVSAPSWTDQSSNNYTATQGTMAQRPIFRTNIFNSLPAMQFTTGAPGMHFTLGANYLFSANDGITIVAVVRSTFEDRRRFYIMDFGMYPNGGYGLGYSANSDGVNNNISFYAPTDAGGSNLDQVYQVNTTESRLVVGRIKFAPAADKHMSILINSSQVISDTTLTLTQLTANEICEFPTRGGGNFGNTPSFVCLTNNDNSPVVIGGQGKIPFQNTGFFDGYIALILWYGRALTDNERKGVECYAALKYGISLAHTCKSN